MISGALASADEVPIPLPSEKLIRSLITLDEEIKSNRINVAMVLRGKFSSQSGFVYEEAVRVLMVRPVIEDGRSVRRVAERIFHWNQKWGWFCYREEQRRSGAVILIFSEKAGLVEIK